MDILETIVTQKRKELEDRRKLFPERMLEKSQYFSSPVISLSRHVSRSDGTGIIAEFKRRSPSKGVINAGADVQRTTTGYVEAGAAALSVLTDGDFFGGANDDLTAARKVNKCPILRKDFTIDEYHVIEARSIGADAILLIAAILTPPQSKSLAALAHSLGMEVLLEVHNEEELEEHLEAGADLIGVNNRNLKTFEVSIDVSKRLSAQIPENVVRVSESGISSADTIVELRNYGFQGFLIGENFMKSQYPEAAAFEFINMLRAKTGANNTKR